MNGKELLVWWGDELLDVQHGTLVQSTWTAYDQVCLVLRPTQLAFSPSRPALFLALVASAVTSVAALGLGAWLQRTDTRALHARATHSEAAHESAPEEPPSAPLASWIPPELCVPPPSPSDQDDERQRIEYDERAERAAYSPRGARGASEGTSPMHQQARSPQARTIAEVLASVDWQRPVSAYQNALDSRAGDEWWSAAGEPGGERIRIRGMGYGGGGRGVGTISLGTTIGVGEIGRRGCTSMICRPRRLRRGPHVRLGRPTVIGALDDAHVRRVAARGRRALVRCYAQSLGSDAGREGRMTVHAFVSPYGNVRSAIVAHTDIDDDELSACFVEAIRTWSFFMPDDGGMVSITYPFELRRSLFEFRR